MVPYTCASVCVCVCHIVRRKRHMYSARPFRSYTYNFTLLKLLGIKDHKDRPYLFHTDWNDLFLESSERKWHTRGWDVCLCVYCHFERRHSLPSVILWIVSTSLCHSLPHVDLECYCTIASNGPCFPSRRLRRFGHDVGGFFPPAFVLAGRCQLSLVSVWARHLS